jgi:hypothetical protein
VALKLDQIIATMATIFNLFLNWYSFIYLCSFRGAVLSRNKMKFSIVVTSAFQIIYISIAHLLHLISTIVKWTILHESFVTPTFHLLHWWCSPDKWNFFLIQKTVFFSLKEFLWSEIIQMKVEINSQCSHTWTVLNWKSNKLSN